MTHSQAQQLPEGSRLRVGVLAFNTNGCEKDQDFALSLSHEVASALARFRWFDVINPIAMMQRPLVILLSKDIFQRQQVDYTVDGTITRRGQSHHIDVQLSDFARCARPAWSDRLELGIPELHRLNELVTARIVGSIDPVILFIEGRPKRREQHWAAELSFLAISLIYSMERRKSQKPAT
jgi:TolB-like protein